MRGRRLFETAVTSGEKRAEESIPGAVPGELWNYYGTRSYLRALHGLARELENQGRFDDAIVHYRRLLRLDEPDHQSVRYCLLSCLLLAGQFREAERHIKAYESPDECVWLYSRALAAFGRYGDTKTSRKALERAIDQNPYAADRLLDEDDEAAPGPEIDEDANSCVRELMGAWSKTPGALDWLEESVMET